jgi:MFS transporter, DHA2 family, multidrug resistance protein
VNSAATPRKAELPPLQGTDLLLVTVAISLATFMEVLDMTIVNVSVPSIAGTLGVSPNEGTWTITSYTLAAAIMQPLTGWLARRFGEVRTFTASTLLFVISSALCGVAVNMPMLVVFRLMQGLVSGPMAPMAQSLLMRSYPPEKRGAAMGIWGMVVFVAPIFGPILGGWITDNLSWPWLFYINVPVGLIAATAVWGLLRRRETVRHRVPVDVTGLLLLFAGVGALQFMLDNGNEKDWFGSPVIIAAAVAAVICLTLLIAWELTERHPVVDLHLFRFRNFRVGMAGLCAGYAAFFGITVIVPLFLETTVGYTATQAGMASAPVGLLGIFLLPIVGAYLPRLNMRVLATCGFLLVGTVTYWLSGLTETATFWQYALPRVLQGVGMSFIFLPMQQILLSDIDATQLASAAGLSNFLRNITGSMSTAGCIWLWSNRTDYHHATLAEHVTAGGAWTDWSARLANAGLDGGSTLAHTENVLMQQARVIGANDVCRVLTALLIVVLPLVWLARPPFSAARQRSAH